ncbi:MAG: SRPBCC family protein [Phycisphaerae bacterium]|nr:SRPBCC family protein [Phycisphaerae bacterium]
MLWIWIVGGLLGVLVATVLVFWLIGRALPDRHVIDATLTLDRPAAEVFAALADTPGVPSWDKGVTRVERLPEREGRETWRWVMGRNRMVLETTRHEPPRVLVRTIADEAQFFSGDWTFEVRDAGRGCAVHLTEHGRIHSAIPRAMMKHVVDPAMYLKRHLRALAAKFGEDARIETGKIRFGP